MYIPQWNEEEDINCSRKNHVETVNEEMKERSSAEEEIGIRKRRIISQFEIMNKEVKGCKYSLKQQEAPPEITKTK